MLTGRDDVRLQLNTGSNRPTAKVTRLTQLGHPIPWTCTEKTLTLGLRVSGAGLAMKRREVMALVGASAVAWPASAPAQPGKSQEEGHAVNNVPDYVATREHSGPPTVYENLRHHGGWLRVDGQR